MACTLRHRAAGGRLSYTEGRRPHLYLSRFLRMPLLPISGSRHAGVVLKGNFWHDTLRAVSGTSAPGAAFFSYLGLVGFFDPAGGCAKAGCWALLEAPGAVRNEQYRH